MALGRVERDADAGAATERTCVDLGELVDDRGRRRELPALEEHRDVHRLAGGQRGRNAQEHPGPRQIVKTDPTCLTRREQLDGEIHRVSIRSPAHETTYISSLEPVA